MIDKLDIPIEECILTTEEIESIYIEIKQNHDLYLKKHNVKMPSLKTQKGEYNSKALWLVFLYKHQKYFIHKDLISDFVVSVIPTAAKDQQIRHLAEDGWYVLNKGEIVPRENIKVPSGYHLLFDISVPKPTFLQSQLKRVGRLGASSFEDLIVVYDNKCATCGAERYKKHPRFPEKVVELQQGHMDPNKPLTLENTIPQCQICNQTYKDYFVFDNNGYIKKINNPNFVLKSTIDVQHRIFELLKQNNDRIE